jgi:hypothetical protein
MPKHVYRRLGKRLKMSLGILKQKLEISALMIMGNHSPRDPVLAT